jgi:hypothetical protein
MNRVTLFLSLFLAAATIAAAQTTDLPSPATNAPPAPSTPSDTNPAPATNATSVPADIAPAPAPIPAPAIPQPSFQPSPAQTATAPQNDIDDIRPPYFFLQSWSWFWIALAAFALLALLALLFVIFKPHRLLSPKSAYDLTLEKLEKARAILREDNPVPYAVFVSEAIRAYLGHRFHSPSTRCTTDEFLRLMESDPNTPLAGHRDLLRHFLQSCDLVKFARYQPTLQELEDVQQRAWNFVTATKPEPASPQRSRA